MKETIMNLVEQILAQYPEKAKDRYLIIYGEEDPSRNDEIGTTLNADNVPYMAYPIETEEDEIRLFDLLAEYESKLLSTKVICMTRSKELNMKLEKYLEKSPIPYIPRGWTIRSRVPNLGLSGYENQLEEAVSDFIRSSEGQVDVPRFYKFNNKGIPTGIIPNEIANDIKDHETLRTIGSSLYFFDGSTLREDRHRKWLSQIVKNRIKLSDLILPRNIRNVVELLESDLDIEISESELNTHPKDWVHFKNGYWNPIDERMEAHDPQYNTTYRIPFDYDPETAPDPVIDRFLEELIPDEEDREMILQYFGTCMTSSVKDEPFMIIFGIAGSGKTTLLNLFNRSIGADENIATVSLHTLATDKFANSTLIGKLVGVFDDISGDAETDWSNIKALTGGGVGQQVERKYQDAITVGNNILFAKMIFTANSIPLLYNDETGAVARRLCILQMTDRSFTKEDRVDPNIEEKLEKGIGYFHRLCMEALHRKMTIGKGLIFKSTRSKEKVKEISQFSSSIQSFLYNKCARIRGAKINTLKFWEEYQQYCIDMEIKPIRKRELPIKLSEIGIFKVKSHGIEYYSGIDMIDALTPEMMEKATEPLPRQFEQINIVK